MISLTLVSLALLSSFANAATTLVDIEAIEAHFQQALIVPSLLSTFTPGAVLSVAFSGSDITPGQALAQADVSTKPVVTVSAFNATLTGTFTIAMVDADVVGTDESGGVNRHWLENGVTVSSGTVSNASATTITAYAGPGPASGSGPHRYVVLLYQQPSTFAAPANLSTLVPGVSKFDVNAYAKESGLGAVVAANYFTVEVGTDSTSLPATSAVVTSTLASAAASGASGASGAASGGASSSSTGTAAPAPSNGALKIQAEIAPFLVAAAMMLLV